MGSIERIFPSLNEAAGIALLDLDEAVRVRELGWRGPILLLEGIFDTRDVETADRHRLTVTVHCDDQIDLLAAAKPRQHINIQLKMNSGMNRLGFPSGRLSKCARGSVRASKIEAIGEIGLITHFADADRSANDASIDWQIDEFDAATENLPGTRSLSNSAAGRCCGIRARTATGSGRGRFSTAHRRRAAHGISSACHCAPR